jgi:hypothetical protein
VARVGNVPHCVEVLLSVCDSVLRCFVIVDGSVLERADQVVGLSRDSEPMTKVS